FGLLEAIREYALYMLAGSEEEGPVRLRHARYFFSLAEQAFVNQSGSRQLPLLASMDVDYINVIAALNWLLSNGRHDSEIAELAALMTSYLFYYWDWRGYFAEGREWIEQALVLGDHVLWHNIPGNTDDVDNSTPTQQAARLLKIRGRLLNGAGLHAWSLGDNDSALHLFNDALRVLSRLGNKQGMAAVLSNVAMLEGEQGLYGQAIETYKQAIEINRELGHGQVALALNNLGVVYWKSGDVENARAMYRESLTLWRQMDDPGNMVLALDNLGIVAQYHEEYEAARHYQDEALAICRTFGHKNSLAHVLANMGSRAVAEGEFALAREYYLELLPLLQQQNYYQVIVSCLEGIASLSHKLGRSLEAAWLWGAAEQMRRVNKQSMGVLFIEQHEQNVAAALEQCDPEAFQAAWSEGGAMLTHDALTYAVARLGGHSKVGQEG
ncbi:MAG: tetratricopeptide repeat protein, partial [Chloroflexota bacterium]